MKKQHANNEKKCVSENSKMDFKHINNENEGFFEFLEDGKPAGKLAYKWKDKTTFSIEDTNLYKGFEGKVIGKKMLQVAVDYAIKNNLKIIPVCTFAVSLFQKNEVFQEVILT